jgi:hypothetical protein
VGVNVKCLVGPRGLEFPVNHHLDSLEVIFLKDLDGLEVIVDIHIRTILALDTEHTIAVVDIDAEDGARDLGVAHNRSIRCPGFLSSVSF